MTTAQMAANDRNAHLIETLTGNKPKRTDKTEPPLFFAILTEALRPNK